MTYGIVHQFGPAFQQTLVAVNSEGNNGDDENNNGNNHGWYFLYSV